VFSKIRQIFKTFPHFYIPEEHGKRARARASRGRYCRVSCDRICGWEVNEVVWDRALWLYLELESLNFRVLLRGVIVLHTMQNKFFKMLFRVE
jgi:hypothetical protein